MNVVSRIRRPRVHLMGASLTVLALLVIPAISSAHMIDIPSIVVANPDGSFNYDIVFTAETTWIVGGYELCGTEWCGNGTNTTVVEFADGFCDFQADPGQSTVHVIGQLVDTSHPGRVSMNWVTCGSGNYYGETEILLNTVSVDPLDPPRRAWVLALTSENPARDRIAYRLELEDSSTIALHMIDVTGRLVAERAPEYLAAGTHEFTWDIDATARERLGSGVYYLVAQRSDGDRQVQRVVLLR